MLLTETLHCSNDVNVDKHLCGLNICGAYLYDSKSDIDLLWPPHTTLVLNQTRNKPKASRVHMGC